MSERPFLSSRSAAYAIVVASAALGVGCTSSAAPVARAAGSSVRSLAVATGAVPGDLTADEQAHHVLNRLAFGPRPGDVERVRAMGVAQWIAGQLDPARLDDSAMERQLAAFPVIGTPAGELLREFPPPGLALAPDRQPGAPGRRAGQRPDGTADSQPDADSLARRQALLVATRRGRQLAAELQAARVARAVGSERQLHEVLTDFWLNHFSVFIGKGLLRYHVGDFEREAIRPHVLGRFRDLLGAVAHSPAMLLYLDNALSVADSGRPTLATERDRRRQRLLERDVERRQGEMSGDQRTRVTALLARRPRGLNENYARELLELHTLGVDGGYSQQDVVEVARAFTGWTVRPPRRGTPAFWFNGAAHDAGTKRVLGTRLEGGRGVEDGEEVLDLLARHPSTARFIARKLAVRLVSDEPPEALVARAAETFRRTDGNLREVVRTIVWSPEFFSRAAYRAKVKSPFEVVVSAARALGAQVDTTAATSLVVARLGQPIFGRQSPDGWPETGGDWMNTGAILGRINFGVALAGNRLPGARLDGWPGYGALRSAPREAQVERVVAAFLGGVASPETRAVLLSGVNPLLQPPADASGTDPLVTDPLPDDVAPSGARPPRAASNRAPGDGLLAARQPARREPAKRSPPALSGLDQVIGLALGSPEFQRR